MADAHTAVATTAEALPVGEAQLVPAQQEVAAQPAGEAQLGAAQRRASRDGLTNVVASTSVLLAHYLLAGTVGLGAGRLYQAAVRACWQALRPARRE